MEQLLKAEELAKRLRVNTETIRRWTRAGAIPHINVGKSRRYDLSAVLQALQSKSNPEEPSNE